MFKYTLIVLFGLAFVLSSCGSSRSEKDQLPCINKGSKNFTLRWGEYSPSKESMVGYEINIYGDISFYNKPNNNTQATVEFITTIPKEDVCRILGLTNNILLKTQATYAPGEPSSFLEYTIPEQSVFIRSVWNPKFTNHGNKDFKALLDTLNLLIPNAKELRNKK